jgi:hypothetical protein
MKIDAFGHEGRHPRFHLHLKTRPLVKRLGWIARIQI